MLGVLSLLFPWWEEGYAGYMQGTTTWVYTGYHHPGIYHPPRYT